MYGETLDFWRQHYQWQHKIPYRIINFCIKFLNKIAWFEFFDKKQYKEKQTNKQTNKQKQKQQKKKKKKPFFW